MLLEGSSVPAQPPAKLAWLSLGLFIVAFLVGLFLGNFLAFVAALPLTDMSLATLMEAVANPVGQARFRVAILVLQGVAALCTFLLFPLWFARTLDPDHGAKAQFWASLKQGDRAVNWLAVLLLVLVAMPFSAALVEWNEGVKLPAALAAWEKQLKASEEHLRQLTLFLTDFAHPGEFLLGFLVVALVAGVGEELTFRGILQPKFQKVLGGNPHLAIWLTAFLFSAFHFQFYGLVPRLLLGALFGYLYHWRGSLWLPMLAHVVNNGFTITMLYLHKRGLVAVDINDTAQVPWGLALASALLTAAGLWWLARQPKSELSSQVAAPLP
ncbi:MAG: CPBP family intramembrane metalloprotease [Bernardetiaceae bacterium]|jgi:hypothetical protein|nr:CPBP family intramembrane metalloprotease [Bernardetiaceae bacterium]